MNAPISPLLPTALSPTLPTPLQTLPTPLATARQESDQWHASLQLGFAARHGDNRPPGEGSHAAGSFLTHRLHYGPLRVQRPLYPEGPGICHAVIVHPPGGVAGGDRLHIDIDVGPHSHAVLATPGSTKWYKSNQRSASQQITLRVKDGARLDWLPQNNIVFDDARAKLDLTAEIAPNASAIGWETTQLGRQASGERWKAGQLHACTTLKRPNGDLLWTEQALLDATDPIRDSQQGLGGWHAFGTLWAIAATDRGVHPSVTNGADLLPDNAFAVRHEVRIEGALGDPSAALMDTLNAMLPYDPQAGERSICAGVTRLPNGVILIRAAARRMETLQACFIHCWEVLRPAIHGVASRPLRLWST